MNKQFSERNRRRCEAPDGFNHKLHSWSGSDLDLLCQVENIDLTVAVNEVLKRSRERLVTMTR
jgi:hypothetical protein